MRSPGTAEDCEYPLEGRSRTQQLEETIKKLQSRIGELEATANDGQSSILLHEPYDGGDIPFMALEMPGFLDSWSTPGSVDSTSRMLISLDMNEADPSDLQRLLASIHPPLRQVLQASYSR